MKVIDGILGLAIGDAMGLPIKYCNRDDLLKNPVTKMLGFGNYNVDKGVWSDDTAMTLATADSLTKCLKIDYNDMMKRYYNWLNKGIYTATGEVVDISRTTKDAIKRYISDELPPLKCGSTNLNNNGNEALMRMFPIAYYCFKKGYNEEQISYIAITLSSLTNAHPISQLGCYIYIMYIIFLLEGHDKKESYYLLRNIDLGMFKKDTINQYKNILNNDISTFDIKNIKNSNYVVYTLEAILWVILNTNSFEESIIGAINLGEETDTLGAVTGSIAGLLYGYEKIPEKWVKHLKNIVLLQRISSKFEATFINNEDLVSNN